MQSNAFRRYVVILECVTLEQSCTQEDLESLAEIWPKLSDSERRSLRGSAPCDVARFLGEPPQLWDGRRWRGSREHREGQRHERSTRVRMSVCQPPPRWNEVGTRLEQPKTALCANVPTFFLVKEVLGK